ncbi:MAG: HD domain-containing protein [Sulfurospirillaceae bacterium]|nr:HD domain-containing protein [Sulfurospirillaceae bacterium]
MGIKKIVKLSFLLISVLIILVGLINYIVLYQIRDNNQSQKNISKLVSLQEQMNSLSKDLISSQKIQKLNDVKMQFTQREKNFEETKKMFSDNTDYYQDQIFFDIHSDKVLNKKLHMLFKNEKEIESAFDKAYKLHKEKIYLLAKFKLEYPQEDKIRKEIESEVLRSGNYNIMGALGNLKYYSKETLYQKKDRTSLNEWLKNINEIKDATNLPKLDKYEKIVKKISNMVIRINQIEAMESKITDDIFHIIKQNSRVNSEIQNRIEAISSTFINSSNFFALFLLGFVILVIIILAFRVNKNVGLSVDEIEARVQEGLEEIKKLDNEIIETQQEVIFTMGTIGEQRSKETGNHVKRVAEYSKLFAKLYGLSEVETEMIKQVSPMHDIGKVAIPDSVLNKPGKFTAEERAIMDTHANLGYDMLKGSNKTLLKMAAIVAKEHHEKWDGTGYPDKKRGKDIHIFGRITAIADVFDALGSDRVYKKAWADDAIFELFKQERGKHFDPKLVDIFFEHLDEFLKIRDEFKD